MKDVVMSINYVNGNYQQLDFSLKEFKEHLFPDAGMPIDLGLTIRDSGGKTITIGFDTKGICTIINHE